MEIRQLSLNLTFEPAYTWHPDGYKLSTDHAFGDWARLQRPGIVPIVVLPSVWYSIILQYTGRNEDDYTAFTRFLISALAMVIMLRMAGMRRKS